MKIPFMQTRQREYAIERLSPTDLSAASAIHREDFTRPWGEDEFEGLMAQDTVFGFVVREKGRGGAGPVGFVLARLAAGEGEILTVAVARSHRRLGLGWQLLDAVLRELHRERADALFLEVDETNLGAIALYKRLGFSQVGRRPGYYPAEGKPASGALVMRRDLR
jgi:ribosomal-protein-alanine N-acetyltransferase